MSKLSNGAFGSNPRFSIEERFGLNKPPTKLATGLWGRFLNWTADKLGATEGDIPQPRASA